MTFVGLFLGVLSVSIVGILSALAARRKEELKQSQTLNLFRTMDHSARIPAQPVDEEQIGATNALAGLEERNSTIGGLGQAAK